MSKQRLKKGDVLQLRADTRYAYVQYLGRHSEYGDAIAVVAKCFETTSPPPKDLFAEAYITFYPASAALAQGLVQVVSNLPAPDMPKRWRRAGKRVGPQIINWIIEDDGGDTVRTSLTAEEARLPIAAIWNHDLLLTRICEGWSPQAEAVA